jgi:hypothetical protein
VNTVHVKTVLATSALLLALASPAAAQGQLGVGVAWLDSGDTGTGITVDYSYPIIPFTKGTMSVVGDLGLNKFVGATVSSYLGGVRFRTSLARRVSAFGQFLAGVERCCGSTDTALQPGVGIEVSVHPMLNLRAQVDFRTVQLEGDDAGGQRYTFGASLPIPARR